VNCSKEAGSSLFWNIHKKWLRIIKETPFFMNIPESELMSSPGKEACRRDMALIHCHVETVLI
jgi:hypothetical protein